MISELSKSQDTSAVNVEAPPLGYCLANEEETAIFQKAVGERVLDFLRSLGATLYADPWDQRKTVKTATKVDGQGLPEKYHLVRTNYERSKFSTVIDDRLVFLTCFLKRPNSKEKALPDRILQIDFIFFQDWTSKAQISDDYKKTHNTPEGMGGQGLQTDGLSFLRKMKQLVESIDDDCVLQLCTSDLQRKRIYGVALKGRKNVRFLEERG